MLYLLLCATCCATQVKPLDAASSTEWVPFATVGLSDLTLTESESAMANFAGAKGLKASKSKPKRVISALRLNPKHVHMFHQGADMSYLPYDVVRRHLTSEWKL